MNAIEVWNRRRVSSADRRISHALGGRSGQAGMLVATVGLPATFQRTLMPRSNGDQGFVTGLTIALEHSITSLVQNLVEALAHLAADHRHGGEVDNIRWRRITFALDMGVMVGGNRAQALLRQRKGDSTPRGMARTAAYWVTVGAAAGGAIGGLQEMLHQFDAQTPGRPETRAIPVALPLGLALASVGEFARRRREAVDARAWPADGDDEQARVSAAKSLAIGIGVQGALSGMAAGERAAGAALGSALSHRLPGGEWLWQAIGRAAVIALLGAAVGRTTQAVYEHVERGERRMEPAFNDVPGLAGVSGSDVSHVPFETLDKQGRRNVATVLRRSEIEAVMEAPARQPIRVYVGLRSAATGDDRVRMAVAELDRTGAFDRGVLAVISPTGTGYVNYVAVEAMEYFSLGDMASVTMQYAERPSVLSLDRVWAGRMQNRKLLEALHERLRSRPARKRPRLILFGESLGAHTSQDAFLHRGTRGLLDLGIDAAIWSGTPYGSGWKNEVLGPPRPDVEPSLVGAFDHYGQLETMTASARERVRFVMITHDNDAVTKFGADLLWRRPDWLGPVSSRPPAIPKSMRYSSPATFLLTLVDMKNSAHETPGEFEAKGHDYRADLARFVDAVYRFDAAPGQLRRVESALRKSELDRKERIDRLDDAARRWGEDPSGSSEARL